MLSIKVIAETPSWIIPYDPNTMSFTVTLEQAVQKARDWAGDPNLQLDLRGINIIKEDKGIKKYAFKTPDNNQQFDVDCNTGKILWWIDFAKSRASRKDESNPSNIQTMLPAEELNGIVRSFISSKYPECDALNMQNAYPEIPGMYYFQRLSNGVWNDQNNIRCSVDAWRGIVVSCEAEFMGIPSLSTSYSVTPSIAEQAAISYARNELVDDPDDPLNIQTVILYKNRGVWITKTEQGEYKLAYRIELIASVLPNYTIQMYEQAVNAGLDGDEAGYATVYVDANTGDVFDITGENYNVYPPTTSTPAFSLAEGTYTSNQAVTITCVTSGSTIRYTTDGTNPTTTSTEYAGPITVDSSMTLKARAYSPDHKSSLVKSATYTLKLPSPTMNPAGGNYTGSQLIIISCVIGDGTTIRYTTDGTDPTESSTEHTGPITVSQSMTIKAKAFKTGWTNSEVVTVEYVMQ